ncbi:MAG: glycosyltransferase family 9 protein [Deltaproteobacteria bacterium]|nr:MAG: glycosyltransferase family 9 protein [Deltaproteobacteria bacterium]
MNPLPALTETREGVGPIQSQPGWLGASSPKNLLILQLARLGDLVQTWPLLTRLRQAYPGARLTLLTDHRLLPLQAAGPKVEEVLGFDFLRLGALTARDWPGAYRLVAELLKDLQARDFDLMFNLNFSRLSLLLTHLLGVQAKGYLPAAGGREFSREPWLAWIYSLVHARQFNRFHLTDVFRHLAPEPAWAPPGPRLAAIPRREPVIALQLATRHQRRTWPLAHFTRLAEHLVSRLGARVLLLGTASERGLGEKLRAALAPALREGVVNLQGATGLAELAGQLQQAHLLVSGDTGTLHLAAALGVPTAALFLGPALCFETGPYGSGHYVLQAEPPCHPCTEAASPCPPEGPICLEMLPPQTVARFIAVWLETGTAPGNLPLPSGSRIYRSGQDDFGVRYQYLGEEPPRFVDLVGRAYRRAGAWLAAPSPKPPPPNPYEEGDKCPSGDLPRLEVLLAVLNRGAQVPPELPQVTEALRPLLAFQDEMQRQGQQELFFGVKEVFTAQLENCLSVSR